MTPVAMGVENGKDVSRKRDGCCDFAWIRWHVHFVGASKPAHHARKCNWKHETLGWTPHKCLILRDTGKETRIRDTSKNKGGAEKVLCSGNCMLVVSSKERGP